LKKNRQLNCTRATGLVALAGVATIMIAHSTIYAGERTSDYIINKECAILRTDEQKFVTIAQFSVDNSAGIAEILHNIEVEDIGPMTNSNEEEKPDNITEEIIDPRSNYTFDQIAYVDVNTELNIRQEPNTDSTILKKLNWMDEVRFTVVNDDWACIKVNDDDYGYISTSYLTDTKLNYEKKYTVTGDKAKTYMDFRCITSRESKQYKLQKRASTDSKTGIRTLRGRYMIALGSYYKCSIGQYVDLVLSNGETLKCIIGDAKQDRHTNKNHMRGMNGDVAEFIVDTKVLKKQTKVIGDVSRASKTFIGRVIEVRKYDHIEN
jgi:uncharacterized protein YgiM (DUF1202 family)